MKRKLSIRLLLVTAAVTGLASGCGTGAHQQVIGEKQETRTEQENITEGTSADGAADRHELRVAEQVQAPERYKTEVKDKGLYLTADASVEVPDLDRAPREPKAGHTTMPLDIAPENLSGSSGRCSLMK